MNLADRIDFQFLGGRYDTAPKLLNDYPDLKTRWTYEELTELCELLGELELEGIACKKGAQLLEKYLKLRGEEGDLVHCIDYNTSEYCVTLKLFRNEQYRMLAQQRRIVASLRRDGYDVKPDIFKGVS